MCMYVQVTVCGAVLEPHVDRCRVLTPEGVRLCAINVVSLMRTCSSLRATCTCELHVQPRWLASRRSAEVNLSTAAGYLHSVRKRICMYFILL